MGAGAPPSLRRPATASQLSPSPPASRRRRSPGTGLPPGRPRAASASLLVQPRRGSSRAVFRQLPRCVGRRRRWQQPGLTGQVFPDAFTGRANDRNLLPMGYPKRGQDSSNRADGTCFQGASKSPVPFSDRPASPGSVQLPEKNRRLPEGRTGCEAGRPSHDAGDGSPRPRPSWRIGRRFFCHPSHFRNRSPSSPAAPATGGRL